MSLKELCQKKLKIKVKNKSTLINKCQCYINEYFTKLTKNRKGGWYCKKYARHCLARLEFINKQKINAKLWFLTLQCQNNHQIIKKLIFKQNKWKIINIKN
ncbi:replication/maintenance protein RepL [Spiroplasma endosymbiont of Polydrusus formosus]|uniref:replication/maintenance protein RepL n=1 Tax=Spiroplasma endosymbiont of Polydrusus formosus TaxID=3139326 RepID=UPI0035B52B4A